MSNRDLKPMTFHNGQYRASIGSFQTEHGDRKPKVFMLGKDERIARMKEQNYRKMWEALLSAAKSKGLKKTRVVWTNEALRRANLESKTEMDFLYEAIATIESFNSLASNGDSLITPTTLRALGDPLGVATLTSEASPFRSAQIENELSLHSAVKKYMDHLENRVKANDLSSSNYQGQCVSMRRLRKAMRDCSLAAIDFDKLQSLKLHFQSRPKVKGGKAMKWGTVKTTMGHIRAFFRWLEDTDKWACKRWARALRPKQTAEDADNEDEAKRIDYYAIEELTAIYAAATAPMRAMILLALNTASEAQAISTMKPTHFRMIGEQARLARRRNKKSSQGEAVYGEWDLWAETWEAVQTRMKQNPKPKNPKYEGRAFLGRQGNPLVSPTKSGRVDSLNLAFADICKAANVRSRGFSMLRKNAQRDIENVCRKCGDTELASLAEAVADAMGSHSPNSVLRKSYSQFEFSHLHKALNLYRAYLQPLFDKVKAETRAA